MIERRHLITALVLHAVLFGLLFASALFHRKIQAPPAIEAVLIADPRQSRAENIAPPTPPAPEPEPQPEPEPPKPPPKPPEPTPEQLQQKQQQEEEKKRKAEAEQEKKRLVDAERQRKQAELKAEAERKRKEEQLKKAEAEQKRQEEQRIKREEEQRRKDAEAEMKRKLEAEKKEMERQKREAELAEQRRRQAALEAAMAAELQGRIQAAQADWGSVLASRIRKFWTRPAGSADNFRCVVQMRLAPNGDVLDARVVSSCGTEPLDRSVEAAVLKASPMPLPPDPKAFTPDIKVTFCPNPAACQ